MMHSDFVPLHLHTEYSLLDGAIRIDDLIAKAKEYNLPAIAMTDHGNLFGAIEFYKKVSKAGLKPIIGCEVYIAPKTRFDRSNSAGTSEKSFHMILLCRDIDGYRNLTRLVSSAFLEGFYYKPRIDRDILEQHSGGLIGLSACLKGEIPHYLAAGMKDKARETALEYRRIFGADNFYLEIQANELPEQEEVNKQIIELSRDLHIPLAATNDCHYLNREDSKAHDVLLCIQTGKTLNDANRMKFSKDTFYFKSPEEMKEAFKEVPEAVENTRRIAEKCNLDFTFGEFQLPKYELPDGEDDNNYVKKLAEQGLNKKLGGDAPDIYRERLVMELEMIKKMGFSSYFLIVWDFIKYAKSKDIPVGPGRGSAAGSLVAYSLDITDIDPIKYGLLFERFLNPERVSMPDIDVDFCMDRRNEVIEYVTNKYGKDHVAQIITFGTMQARAAIRDVGRAMNIPYSEVDKVAKLVPFVLKITLKTALEMEPKLKELYDSDTGIKELIDVAQTLEGISRHASTHAAGIVISPDPLTDFLPLYKAPNDEAIVTQFDMDAIKTLGLLKFDFLGLKTLTIIDMAERIINDSLKQEKGDGFKPFKIGKIPLDDKSTFELLCAGKTAGVFQLESSGMRDLLTRMRPDVFEDMIALVALYRPGPLGSGMVDEYIDGKKAKHSSDSKPKGSLAKLGLPQLDKILKETHGIILYQEQVMEIAHKMANFSLAQADILRKAMGGKNPEEMEKMKAVFIEGLKTNKVSEKKAATLYNLILQFAQYGFNKSHSAAYAYIAYQTAYLKAHYPVEFMAASLSADMDNTAKVVIFINECKEMEIEILPPDINESTREFKVTGNSIRFGLEAVKGVGGSAIDAILETRTRGNFSSFSDFCLKADSRRVNKKVIESLIKAGAMDSMGKRAQLMEGLPDVMEAAVRYQKEQSLGQESMFGDIHETPAERLPIVEEWNETKLLAMEKEALGFYITGHPLNKYKDKLVELGVTPTIELQDLQDKQEITLGGIIRDFKQIQTKKGDLMAYLNLEDLFSNVEVIAFPDIYKEAQDIIAQDTPVVIAGYLDKTDKGLKIIAQKIASIENTDDLKNKKPMRKPRHWNGKQSSGSGENEQAAEEPKQKSFTLTMFNDTKPETLPKLEKIFSKYSGNHRVYLKIISPKNWETVLSTNRHVMPSEEMLIEVEELLGKEKITLNGMPGIQEININELRVKS
ncbi:MAG: DNA polymerase III subunit alpha [Nitrospirae bacterium]|nr:DNA polymerase III subunit alpha [Nitrospirota bacterium]